MLLVIEGMMGIEDVNVPRQAPRLTVRVVSLWKGKNTGPFAYLQGMRSGSLRALNPDPEQTEAARGYHRNKGKYAKLLAEQVPSPINAIVSPPSRMPWQAELYRDAITALHTEAIDLTARVTKRGDARASAGATLDDVLAELSYVPTGKEQSFKRIVIADDTFTTGTTAAAMVLLMQQHGLPGDCEVIIACPLWLDTVVG